uniref:D-glutamate cyclase-like C-terminal domain-containing protein n=1 Tax=Denticeps clupeoides TaxID=299321 RepID=A0AAY4B3K6_9TELE
MVQKRLVNKNTSLVFKCYQQANVVILHKSLADDFEEFCRVNQSPLPLLYRSQLGDWSCPPLAAAADIRTDCPQYCVFQKGQLVDKVADLKSFAPQLQDMVVFYLGCSFGFEKALEQAGVPVRNVEQGRNVSMFRTTVPCVTVGRFECPMVVTMRPVPPSQLDAVSQCTHPLPEAHGGPVHIGDAALLGIQDVSRPDYGDPVEPSPGDVPVFWACGVTGVEAVQSCKPELAFTHSPGCMFLTDQPETTPLADPSECPLTFCISQNPLHYSMASRSAVERLRHLEKIIGEDPGQRGIEVLFVQDELLRSCLSLSHSSSVLVSTAMLQALGKQVTMVSDQRALEMNRGIILDAVEKGVLQSPVPLVCFQGAGPEAAMQFLCHDGDPKRPRFDHLVAIERSGRASDGNYYNMRGINIRHLVDPVDDLFTTASTVAGISSTGIGDGGNELGMGKVKDRVKAHMPKGSLIACDVAADFAITAGVSNWGGYAVACGLYVLNCCPVHQRYLRRGLGPTAPSPQQQRAWNTSLPSVPKEEEFLSILVKYGIRSGKTANLGMEVDGLTFHPTHSDLIQRLRDATLAPRTDGSMKCSRISC